MQLCIITLVSLVLACLDFLSPNPNCEVILITVLLLDVFLGMMPGYVSACLCKSTGVSQWKNNALIIAFLYPGIAYGILFDLKLVLWSYHPAAAILFITLLALIIT